MTKRRIIILGFMGSGKSTVARALAQRLHAEMVDLDDEIERAEQRTPKQIIEAGGEPMFREIETRVLESALQNEGTRVIALGGGAWTPERNRKLIAEHEATSVWIDGPFDLCWERILASSSERPLARTKVEALTLYQERRATYELAEVHVSVTKHKSADEIAEEIITLLSH